MKNYRIVTRFDSIERNNKECYFYWVEKRVLFFFWMKQNLFWSMEEAKLYIDALHTKPTYL